MRNVIKNIGLLVLSLVVSFLLGEGVIRAIAPQQLILADHRIWRPDETVGWRHVENTNIKLNAGEGMVHFVTDRNGYRINSLSESKAGIQPDISILTIGDSFLEGIHVENRYTMPQLIQKALIEKYKKEIRVVNAGVGGWEPSQYLIEAKLALKKAKYDLGIIFLYADNDIVENKRSSFSPREVSAQRFRFPRSLKWTEIVSDVFYPINDFLETRSHLFILFRVRFQTVLAKLELTALYFPPVFKLSEKNSRRWQTTTEICKEIEQVFAQNKTPVFFVLLPAPYQVQESELYNYMKMFNINRDSIDINQPNVRLKETFRASLHLVDPLEYMRGFAKQGLIMYGYIHKHFNKDGHRVVAEYILPVVEEYLFSETHYTIKSRE